MRYHELAEPEHPTKRERPRDIASLSVYTGKWPDLTAIRYAHGRTEIVGIENVPVIPVVQVEVLCRDRETALALLLAWTGYGGTSPHRPHSNEETLAWGEKYNPCPGIPSDWTL